MPQNVVSPALSGGSVVVIVAILVLMIATMWRIFTKAGQAGWKCLIPIYSAVVFQRVIGRPGWWVVLMFLPVVNLVIALVECFDLARVFGKGPGFGIGLVFLSPIFALILAFGPAKYVGNGGKPAAPAMRKAA